MNTFRIFAILLTFIVLSNPNAYAQNNSCFDAAQNNAEVNKCGSLLISPLEAQVKVEFQRIAEKYKGNDAMQEILRNTKESWNGYRNVQCMLESMAAAGGQSIRPLPLEANKSFLMCVSRTLLEMQAVIYKL